MVNMRHGKLDFDGVDPELGMHLLSLYWTRHLHAGLVVFRPAFMRDMASNGPYFSKLLLNAMLYSVSKHSSRPEIQNHGKRDTRGWLFRQRFTKLLQDESNNKSSIPTIQALLIMASSLFTRGNETSTSWLYAGTAFNMVIDLGLHVESRTLSTEDQEIRRRVFWASFCVW
jgi:hypothetical protein